MRPPPPRTEDFEGWDYWVRRNERRIYRAINDMLASNRHTYKQPFTRYDPRGLVVSRDDYEYALSCVTPQIMSRIGPAIGDVEPGHCFLCPERYMIYVPHTDSEEAYRRRYGWRSDESKARYT